MKMKKRFLSILLSLVMVLGLMPGMSLTAYADAAYGTYLVTSTDTATSLPSKVVKFNDIEWYIIADDSTAVDAGTVTLFSRNSFGTSIFAAPPNAIQ